MSEGEIHGAILSILKRHIRSANLRVFLFGSRATGRATPRSDYDVAVDTGRPVDWSVMARIRSDLEDSDLPVRVDVVDFSTCSPAFKAVALEGALAW